jgi:hypothetical protein
VAVGTAIPEAPSDDRRWRIVETRMRRLGQRPDALIEVLHEAQEAFGYLDTDALAYIAHSLGVPLSKVYGLEAVIRCYDPCLSCSTHAIGQMPLHLRLLAPDGTMLDERRRRTAPTSWSSATAAPCAATTGSAGTLPAGWPPTRA